MILNPCARDNKMVDEKICKDCREKNCNYAGSPTTAERIAARKEKKHENFISR